MEPEMPIEPLFVLIDGNNLAHFLYSNLQPNQKMTSTESLLLINHVGSYSRTYQDQLHIELCLDRSPGNFGWVPKNLRVFSAEYPQTGDDLLLERFWFHHNGRRPCLVITNDEAILTEVEEAHGTFLRVYDFVRRPGAVSPVFRAPDELPTAAILQEDSSRSNPPPSLSASIYFRIIEENRNLEAASHTKDPLRKPNSIPQTHMTILPVMDANPPYVEISKRQAEPEAADEIYENNRHPQEHPEDAIKAEEQVPYYYLSMDSWPVAEGIRFLRNSFCPKHREEYSDLINAYPPEDLSPADLWAMAELLLHACGSEPDFARTGSLMNRVRMALLQERGDPLSITELADRTGYKLSGMQGRLRAKAQPWVGIFLL